MVWLWCMSKNIFQMATESNFSKFYHTLFCTYIIAWIVFTLHKVSIDYNSFGECSQQASISMTCLQIRVVVKVVGIMDFWIKYTLPLFSTIFYQGEQLSFLFASLQENPLSKGVTS